MCTSLEGISHRLTGADYFEPSERPDFVIVMSASRRGFRRTNVVLKRRTRLFGTQAKIAVADRDFCYIGSTNLTETSLSTNFEMCVLMRGAIVRDVARIFDWMFAGGRSVNLLL